MAVTAAVWLVGECLSSHDLHDWEQLEPEGIATLKEGLHLYCMAPDAQAPLEEVSGSWSSDVHWPRGM